MEGTGKNPGKFSRVGFLGILSLWGPSHLGYSMILGHNSSRFWEFFGLIPMPTPRSVGIIMDN